MPVERKIFAGARLKRLRQRLGRSQTQMAADLGLSASYLNLIERNQRPLTVQVLLKLSRVYGIDVTEISREEGQGAFEALKEVFSDPLLAGEIASPAELHDMAETAPNAARGVTRLHQAWREALMRLADLSHRMAESGKAPPETAARLPFDRAVSYFEQSGPHYPELEAAAEELAEQLSPRDDSSQALKSHLRDACGIDVRILPGHVMPVEQCRFDRHSQRLFISERVPLLDRPFLLARQVALSGHRDLLERLTGAAGLMETEAARICRIGFATRLAEAILAPAGRLAAAARELRLDLIRLSARFQLRPSRIMARIAAIGDGREMPAAFTIVLDASGGTLSRSQGAGFPFPRFGPLCARLPLFDEVSPGQPVHAEIVLPDERAFLVVAIAEHGAWSPGLPAPRRLALIGWRREDAAGFAAGWPALSVRPIGVTCRLCERLDCAHRVHPPVAVPAALLDSVVGPSDYELAG